jgi:hypothetical protein
MVLTNLAILVIRIEWEKTKSAWKVFKNRKTLMSCVHKAIAISEKVFFCLSSYFYPSTRCFLVRETFFKIFIIVLNTFSQKKPGYDSLLTSKRRRLNKVSSLPFPSLQRTGYCCCCIILVSSVFPQKLFWYEWILMFFLTISDNDIFMVEDYKMLLLLSLAFSFFH